MPIVPAAVSWRVSDRPPPRHRAPGRCLRATVYPITVVGPLAGRPPNPACYSNPVFDIGLQEMLVIGVMALLVFGPSRLPELGRMIGRAMREFRRASDEFRSTVETNLHINDPDPVIAPEPMSTAVEPAAATPLPPEGTPGTAEDATAPAVVVTETGEPLVAQRNSRLFHRRECSWTGRIPELERVYLKRVAEAREQGFIECPVCEPWEPA